MRPIADAKGKADAEGSEKSVRNRMFFRVIRLFACAVIMTHLPTPSMHVAWGEFLCSGTHFRSDLRHCRGPNETS